MDRRSVSEDMVIEPYAGVNQIQAEYVIMVMIKEYHYVYTQIILKSYHLILINMDLDKQNVFVSISFDARKNSHITTSSEYPQDMFV